MKGSDLRSFIEQAPSAIAMFDRDMRYLVASRRWLDERNLDDSILGRTAYEVFPDVDQLRSLHRRVLAGETIIREENKFQVAHGAVQWVRFDMRPWHETDGEIGGIVVFAEDITARKIAEESLRKSEERFRYAIDATLDGIWDWDLKTSRVAYSPSYIRMLGYDIPGWETMDVGFWLGLLHPDDRERTASRALELLNSPGRYELEFRLRARDGSYLFVLSRGKVVEWDSSGAPARAVGTHTNITDRKAVEEALRKSEAEVRRQHEELQAIYQYAPIGLASFDLNLRYQRINQRLADIGGLPRDAHIGRTIEEVVPAMAPMIEKAARAVLAGRVFDSDREIAGETRAHPGVTRYYKDHWYPVLDHEGKITGCGVVVDDITSRKQIEVELKQISERLELAQSAAKIGIWDWNLLTNEAYVNDQWRLIYGISSDNASLSFESFVARLHPDDRATYLEMVDKSFSGDGRIDAETRIIREDDGAVRWVASKGEVFFNEGSQAVRAMGAVWDITAFKEAQEAMLQRSEDRYRRIIETAQEGVWLLDADGKTSFVNPKMAQLLGYSASDMSGRHLLDFIGDDWRDVAEKKLIDRAAGVVETHDFKFRRRDGSDLWVLLSCAPIFDGSLYQGALAMVMDFTEGRRLAEERQRYLESLKQINSRKDEFLATMGHELRTPLATIALAMDVIESDASLSEKSRAMCGKTQRQVRHLRRMVEDILQVSRMNLGKIDLCKEQIDINHLMVQLKDVFHERFDEAGVRLNIACFEDDLAIFGDELRLTQVFSNLLDNAVKFTDRGGSVRVAVQRAADDAVVSILDSGIGIPQERLSWIFELFNQMKHGPERSREGIGVGLALARTIVELHEGSIEARSGGAGRGAEFIVRLPLLKSVASAGSETADLPEAACRA